MVRIHAYTCMNLSKIAITHFALIHMALEHFIIRLNTRVLKVEMTGNAAQLSAIEIATFLIETHHLCFVKITCSINYKRSLLRN